MINLEECVVTAMDGENIGLFPYLPYIYQDLCSLGTPVEAVVELVARHLPDIKAISVLDLGCGKGAVALELARNYHCHIHGVDAIAGFIEEAKTSANLLHLENHCKFECFDIRTKLNTLQKYQMIILGAIGNVLGDHQLTFSRIASHLEQNGYVVLDDVYRQDSIIIESSAVSTRSQLISNIEHCGYLYVDEVILSPQRLAQYNLEMLTAMTARCRELIQKHPQHAELFENYISAQILENQTLENTLVNSTMLFKRAKLFQ